MRQAFYTQPIAQPAERIWAFIGDLRNDRKWRREIHDVRLLAGEPPHAPATYEETVAWEGLKTTVRLQVAESVKRSRVVVLSDGEGYSSRSVWTFEPVGGTTMVALSFSFETTGALRIAEPFTWTVVSRWLERDLPLLEAHLSLA